MQTPNVDMKGYDVLNFKGRGDDGIINRLINPRSRKGGQKAQSYKLTKKK